MDKNVIEILLWLYLEYKSHPQTWIQWGKCLSFLLYLAWYSLSSAVNGEKTILQSKLMIFCCDKKLWDKSLKSVTGGRDLEVNHQGQHIPSLSPFHGAGSKAWTGMRRRRKRSSASFTSWELFQVLSPLHPALGHALEMSTNSRFLFSIRAQPSHFEIDPTF